MKILFYGGTGQSKVMRPIAEKIGDLKVVLDDTNSIEPPFKDVDFYHGKLCYERWKKNTPDYKEYAFAITIGNPSAAARCMLYQKLSADGLTPLTLIHDTAYIEDSAKIGLGCQIHARSYVGTNVKIGNFCILNTNSIVDHDCILNDGVEIAPGATLCGNVEVGKDAWIGANATILPRLELGKSSIAGAGSVVTRNIPDKDIWVGNPARPLQK